MFHASSSRYERYEVLRRNRVNSTKKKPSFSSTTSGVDSGYNSSTSTSPTTEHASSAAETTSSSSIISEPTESITADSVTTLSPPPPKKKSSNRTKQHQPPRNPDLVYSCPRPLAFPFHNDCHFLPVAEADPRDVVRMHGTPSVASSKASSTTFEQDSACHSIRSTQSPSVRSRSESTTSGATLLSSVQGGTVQSLRSLFSSASKSDSAAPSERLPSLEIRKGTVQSLRELFNGETSPSSSTPTSSNETRSFVDASKAYISAKLGFSGANNTSSSSASTSSSLSISSSAYRAVRNFFRRNSKAESINETTPLLPKDSKSSFFSSPRSWFGRKHTTSDPHAESLPDQLPQPGVTPPPSHTSLTSAIRGLFKSKKSDTTDPCNPSTSRRRSFFSFGRSKSDSESKKNTPSSSNNSSTVSRWWSGFKNIMGGKKTSRVDVL
ncbi:hypothetical protein EC973_001938 [Apophysomyces ossiformis]|uniref:Uncharacterized protein n=1 Tax=Apophysomyces ossiformis TaxID=679940 RepID=A0A8H7C065_9FUNG|nr:hypothetical protein EC973_001938 [Apophysomyces ossiformis]